MTVRFSLTSVLPAFFLAAGLVVSAWSVFISGAPRQTVSPHPVSDQPDGFMDRVSATIFNTLGRPSLHIESPRMTHYPKEDMTHIQKPWVTLYRKSFEPWYVNAELGIARHGIDNLLFTKHVVVHHPGDNMQAEMALKTESLRIFPGREEVNTEEAVTITQPDATVHAVGMNANFNTGIIHLLSDTRSEYVPAS